MSLLAAQRSQCESLLGDQSFNADFLEIDAHDAIISYLRQLLQLQLIDFESLRAFAKGLERGVVGNPLLADSSVHLIHQETLEQMLTAEGIDPRKLLSGLKRALSELEVATSERALRRAETSAKGQRMKFNLLPPGSFHLENTKVKVALPHSIEVMTTPVTQSQWVEIMGDNPSRFVQGEDSFSFVVGGKEVFMQPDHPVESMTWWSAIVYANRISEKIGLPPVYDLSGFEFYDLANFDPERPHFFQAEDKILEVAARGDLGVSAFKEFPKINAPNGDIYRTKGVRLPTSVEQEYLRRGAGHSIGPYYFGADLNQLPLHAWLMENSGRKTHPVAQLKPFIIGQSAFYDVIGNVDEWGHDQSEVLSEGPKYMVHHGSEGNRAYRAIRGGSWMTPFKVQHYSCFRGLQLVNSKIGCLGISLGANIGNRDRRAGLLEEAMAAEID